MIEELNLSNIEIINDELVVLFAKLLFEQNSNTGTSSSINTLILDNNRKITSTGLDLMLDCTAQNTLLRKISLKNCDIEYQDTLLRE